jgi:hypothetical protein
MHRGEGWRSLSDSTAVRGGSHVSHLGAQNGTGRILTKIHVAVTSLTESIPVK